MFDSTAYHTIGVLCFLSEDKKFGMRKNANAYVEEGDHVLQMTCALIERLMALNAS